MHKDNGEAVWLVKIASVTQLALRKQLPRLANLASQMASEPGRDLLHRSCFCSLLFQFLPLECHHCTV